VKRFKFVLLSLLAVTLVVSMAGCGGGSTQQSSAPKDSVTIAIPSEPSTLDAQYADDGNMRDVTDNVVESLLQLNGQTMKVEPSLAVSYSQTGATTWDFKLRPGVKFSNGDPFTADDVVYSVERQISPALKSNIAGNFDTIKSAQKVNDNEVTITTTGPDLNIPQKISLLKILDQKWMQANPTAVNTSTIIGTGPYTIVKWDRAQDIVLARNDSYWGPKPAIKTVTFRFIEEDATREAALNSGEVDMAVNMLPEYVPSLPKVITSEGIESGMVRFNAMSGVFKDPKVRLAAIYAVDDAALVKSLYQGYAKVSNPMLQKSGYIGYDGNLQPYPYDLNKAKQLLAASGYKGQQVQLVGESGRWLKDGELVQTVGQMLTQAGFNVSVKTLAFSDWLTILFDRSKAPDMIFTFHSADTYDVDRTLSTYVESTGPGSAYPNTLDKAIDQARTEIDPSKQQSEYDAISQTLYNDPAWIPLVSIDSIYGVQKNVQYKPRLDGVIDLTAVSLQ